MTQQMYPFGRDLGYCWMKFFSTSFPSQMLPEIRVLVCLQPSEILLRYNINPNLDHNFHIATVVCNLSLIVKFEECRANKSGNTQTKVIQWKQNSFIITSSEVLFTSHSCVPLDFFFFFFGKLLWKVFVDPRPKHIVLGNL